MPRTAAQAVMLWAALVVAIGPAPPAAAATVGDPGGVVRGDWDTDPDDAVDVTAEVRDLTGEVLDVVLSVESADGSFGVAAGGKTTTVTVQADVLFAFDKADLTPTAKVKLADVARELHSRGATGSVTVGGHADSRGDARYNQALSERRARAAAAALQPLVRDLRVTLIPQGFGDTQPVAPNTKQDGSDDPAGRARNRRVTVTFTPPTDTP